MLQKVRAMSSASFASCLPITLVQFCRHFRHDLGAPPFFRKPQVSAQNRCKKTGRCAREEACAQRVYGDDSAGDACRLRRLPARFRRHRPRPTTPRRRLRPLRAACVAQRQKRAERRQDARGRERKRKCREKRKSAGGMCKVHAVAAGRAV